MQAAGKRTKRIIIQSPGTVQTGLNAGHQDWSNPATVCRPLASIEPLKGQELWRAQQAAAEVTHRITIVYRAGITPAMRALYAGRVFWFEAVLNPDEANQELVILAAEVV
jgi:SPP1 family predicted phage head-tail adaptor